MPPSTYVGGCLDWAACLSDCHILSRSPAAPLLGLRAWLRVSACSAGAPRAITAASCLKLCVSLCFALPRKSLAAIWISPSLRLRLTPRGMATCHRAAACMSPHCANRERRNYGRREASCSANRRRLVLHPPALSESDIYLGKAPSCLPSQVAVHFDTA